MMDLGHIIAELQAEKRRLEQAIAELETILASRNEVPLRCSHRGRKSMGMEERQQVSLRMKRYWAVRHAENNGNVKQRISSPTNLERTYSSVLHGYFRPVNPLCTSRSQTDTKVRIDLWGPKY